ncbi:MAG: NADH-quinone oxidoreductase subunit NuoH [Candidatus Eisenbacteria bacterium]|nr:NADH-quinone oxidoreductase subunit NuoH [Candidatus Eisenbacteria bacterium]
MNLFQAIGDFLAKSVLGVDPATWPAMWIVYAVVIALGGFIAFAFVAIFAGPVSWIERRIAGRMQSRIGPNRTGPQGALQWLADGLKCLFKEDLMPDCADKLLFKIAPYFVFTGMFGTFAVLPFGAHLVAADLNVGVLYLLAITGLGVIGILLAGWGSNSKWALFGGIRSAAQLISYEIPSAFGLMTVVIAAGTMSLQGIVGAQGALPWEWFIFRNPFLFAAFFLSLTAAIAESNRTPFDLPEAESELVAGYNVEYSGLRFLFFLFAEWAHIWVMSAIGTACFLGGWQIPGVSVERIAASQGWAYAGWQALSFAIFTAKATVIVFFVIQVRWTVPRLRVDQLMITCWKYLVPLTLVVIVGGLLCLALIPPRGIVDYAVRGVMTALGAAIAILYAQRIYATFAADRATYRKMEGKGLWYPPLRLP